MDFLINPWQCIVSCVKFYIFPTNVSSSGIWVCSLFSNSSRPGRPPKRSLGVLQDNARLLPHAVPGLLSPGIITPTGNVICLMTALILLISQSLKWTNINVSTLPFEAFQALLEVALLNIFEYSGKHIFFKKFNDTK